MSYIEVVDPTRLRDSLQCLRLFYWRHERGVVPAAPRLPLAYGSGVHASLAANYEGKSAGQCLKAFEEVWEREVLPYQTEWMEEDRKRNPVRWAESFMLYRRFYASVDQHFTVKNVEAPFFLPISDKVALGGIIDLLVTYLNQLMVVDHKTTSVTWPSFFAGFNPNHQFSVYLLGASEILQQPVTTALINCIVTHATEQRPEKLFIRQPTTRTPAQHLMLKDEILGWWSIVQACRSSNNWPRNDDRCQRWQGGCDYHNLCTDITTDYRRIIPSKQLFRESVWDPIAALRKAGFKETI
jgi:hypothetical protein